MVYCTSNLPLIEFLAGHNGVYLENKEDLSILNSRIEKIGLTIPWTWEELAGKVEKVCLIYENKTGFGVKEKDQLVMYRKREPLLVRDILKPYLI